jgi:hypothetical protein
VNFIVILEPRRQQRDDEMPDEPDLARARGITPVGLAHDLILADGADRRIARPLVSKCSIGGNFRAHAMEEFLYR